MVVLVISLSKINIGLNSFFPNLTQVQASAKPALKKNVLLNSSGYHVDGITLYFDKGSSGTIKVKKTNAKQKIKWRSSKKKIVSVNRKGQIKALRKGSSIITAKMGKKKLHFKVTVETPTISKKAIKLYVGKKGTLTMKGTNRPVKWSATSNNRIVSILSNRSNQGIVTAKKAGTAKVIARIGKKKYQCTVKVVSKKQAALSKDEQRIQGVVKLMNAERAKVGVPAIVLDKTLNAAAAKRAREIAILFSHNRPNGTSCFSIFQEKGYQVSYSYLGENIAAGYDSFVPVMNGWMNSSGHRANILERGFSHVGIGYYYNPATPYLHYWVQMFGG